MKIFLVAAEPSGDNLGAKLIAALRKRDPAIAFAGIGGERMAGEGFQTLFHIGDLSVMGLVEVIPKLPTVLDRLKRVAAAIRAEKPDAVVLIDSPSFGLRVADRVRDTGVPIVQYVAPQLWAWRPGRAKKLAKRVDRILALFPFEPEFFAKLGLEAIHVGHPALEAGRGDRASFRAAHGVAPDTKLMAVLPGSRRGLFKRMAPLFGAASRLLAKDRAPMIFVVPYVDNTDALSAEFAASLPGRAIRVKAAADKRDALAACDAALSISGTSVLELAIARLPVAVGHRVNALSAFLVRRLVKVGHATLPNLIAGRGIVAERLQEACTPEALAADLARLLDDASARAAMLAGFDEVCAKLGEAEIARGHLPSDRAAEAVLGVLNRS
ncbi:MAG: lipid-A-disaccharide synthase [Tagaea sp.]